MHHPPGVLPQPLVEAIRRYQRHVFARRSLTVLSAGLALALLALLAGVMSDRWLDMQPWVRAIAPVVAGFSLVAGVIGILAMLLRRGDAEHAAGEIDKRLAGSRDVLRSSLDFLKRSPDSAVVVHPYMLNATVARASSLAADIRPAKLDGWGRAPKVALVALLLAGVFFGLFAWPGMRMGLLLRRFVDPFGNHPRPSLIDIAVDAPLVRRVAEGADVVVSVNLAGVVPQDPRCTLHLSTSAGSQQAPMTPRPGGRFEIVLRGLELPTQFFVTAGDGRTARHIIDVDPRPRVVKATAQYTYPGYTRLPKREEEVRFSEFRGVEGTRVRVDFETTMPVVDGAMVIAEQRQKIHFDRNGTKGSFNFVISKDTPFNLQLKAESGVDNGGGAAFRIRLVPDNPPTVAVLNVPENLAFYRDDVLRLNYRGADDFGISEVFVRARGGTEKAMGQIGQKEVSVPFSPQGGKEVSGELAIEIRELAPDENASAVEVELVMVDTKGQEAVSPRLQLTIVSDTLERLLGELVVHQTAFQGNVNSAAGALQAACNQLGVLAEGMDDATKIEGKRAEIFESAAKALAWVTISNVAVDLQTFRLFNFTEFPERASRSTGWVMSNALLHASAFDYTPMVAKIRASASPKSEVVRLKAYCDDQLAQLRPLQAANTALIAETRMDWIAAALDQYSVAERRLAATSRKSSGDSLQILRARQDQRIAAISKMMGDLAPKPEAGVEPTDVQRAFASVGEVIALPQDERDQKLPAAVAILREKIAQSPTSAGLTIAPVHAYLGGASLIAKLTAAAASGDVRSIDQAAATLASRVRLRRDDTGASAAELYLNSRLLQAALTRDPARISGALATVNGLAGWARVSDVSHRVSSLRASIRDLHVEWSLGRTSPDNVRFDQVWQAAREWVLSLSRDQAAKLLDGLDPQTAGAISVVTQLRPMFETTAGSEAQRLNPGLRDTLLEILPKLDACITACESAVEAGNKIAAADSVELLRDTAANFTGTGRLMAAEIEQIRQEVAAAPPIPEIKRGDRVRGSMAKPERMAFAVANNHQLIGLGVAVASAMDVREMVFTAAPTPEVADDLAVLSIFHEFLANAEEQSYERTIGAQIAQVYGHKPYPAFLEDIRQYYAGLIAGVDSAAGWMTQGLASRPSALLKIEAFERIPTQLNKLPRYNDGKRSMQRQIAFASALASANSPQARVDWLLALRDDTAFGWLYWERALLALKSVADAAESASTKPVSGAWAGVSDALRDRMTRDAAAARVLFPSKGPAADESREIGDVLALLDGVLAKTVAARVAATPEGEREGLREELARWQGEVLGVIRNLDIKAMPPATVVRPPARLMGKVRADMFQIESRLMRNEMAWASRTNEAGRRAMGARVDVFLDAGPNVPALATATSNPGAITDGASAQRWCAKLAASEGSIRRKSAAVVAQRTKALGITDEGPEAQFIKMPRYLYEELIRATAKPYPEQFKETGLKYIDGLVKDAR